MIAALILLGLTGCDAAKPVAGTTATASPPASVRPKSLPDAGRCHAGQALDVYHYRATTLNAVDCAAEHDAEIVRVGRLTSPPENKTKEVYTDCDTAAREYVGGDWHDGRLGIAVIVPSTDEWIAGVQEYRCALFEFAAESRSSKLRTGSLKDGLRGARPLALTCMEVRGTPDGKGWFQDLDPMIPIDCAQPHNGEYIGSYVGADVPHPGMTRLSQQATEACDAKATAFLGKTFPKSLRVVPSGGNPDWWALGERTARCYVVTGPDDVLTKSLKA
ncbi:hypothetical protein GCM10010532_060340 [Dactylosporangium siamense]|uniref:Septum formation-related domain-containing protein n=2 Tax=Dactylosporangium siamense TaxID=685454 RepID=A0A919PUW9_9ACTN|nr:hypothetical protein Dsi01nite_082030 [Dactylosporangium siamense]